MKTQDINRTADKAYRALQVLDGISWTSYRTRCFDMACEEERDHRRGKPDFIRTPKGATVPAAGKLFVVKRIAEALLGERPLTVADYISVQHSAFYAQSLVANYREQIEKAWHGENIAQLAALDYVQFINNGEVAS